MMILIYLGLPKNSLWSWFWSSNIYRSKARVDFLNRNSQKTDLILSDIQIPDLGGLQFLAQSKNLFPQIPVLMMTAFGTVDNVVEVYALGQRILFKTVYEKWAHYALGDQVLN